MTNINDLFPSKYLKASDIVNEPTVVISRVGQESMKNNDGKEEVKPILYFNEFEKGVVLNRTNANIITDLYGPDIDEWVGKKIQLHTPDVEGFGKVAPAIRVKSQKPPMSKAELMAAFSKLFERGKKAGVEDIEHYVVSPTMTEQEIIDLGKELKEKTLAAEAF